MPGFANEDMVPLGTFTRTPDVFATRPGNPFKTFKEVHRTREEEPGKSLVIRPAGHPWPVVLDGAGPSAIGREARSCSRAEERPFNTLLGGHVQTGKKKFLSQFAVTGKAQRVISLALDRVSTKMGKVCRDVPFFKDLGTRCSRGHGDLLMRPKGTPETDPEKLTTTLQEWSRIRNSSRR